MGESIKRNENRGKYGFMGYGLTFVAFQTNYLKIESVYENKKSTRTYNNLYKFIFNSTALPESEEEINNKSGQKVDEESYTIITLKFPSEFPDETLESNINLAFDFMKDEKTLEYILRRKSAIGITDSIFNDNLELFEFNIKVNDNIYDIEPGYLTTKNIINRLYDSNQIYDIKEYKSFLKNINHLNKDTKKQAQKSLLIDGVFKEVKIGKQKKLNARIYIATTSKNHLNIYTTKFKNIEEFDKISVENGIWLSIDGLPTGICLDQFNHPSFLAFTVVVDILDTDLRNDLDSGRKGITAYRKDQICKKVKETIAENDFIKYRNDVLGTTSRITYGTYDPVEKFKEDLSDKEKYETKLIHKYFPTKSEQDVISLFTEFISKDIIKGYNPLSLSSYEVYDGYYNYRIDFRSEFFSGNDCLGIAEPLVSSFASEKVNRDILIEFKSKLSDLFKDINNLKKNINQIDLLVCWNVQFDKANDFMDSEGIILNKIDKTENVYYGATHQIIGSGRSNFLPIIELKTVVEMTQDIEL
jgi:hypothetical protein